MYIPSIVVLMSTYNGIKWIAEQIDSIQNQCDVNVCIYFSDDCSTDGTKAFIEKFKSDKIELVLLPSTVKFGSAGSNFLRLLKDVDFSRFDYVAFSDQDDVWLEGKLRSAIDVITLNAVDGYSSNVTAFWPNGSTKVINKSQAQQKYDYMFESAGPGCSFVFTKKLAIDLQKFLLCFHRDPEGVALHDWFTYAFARSRGYKWVIDEKSHLQYRQHERNVLGANVGLKAKISRLNKMCSGWHIKQTVLIAKILGYDKCFPISNLQRYSFKDRVTLILNSRQFRRRLVDSLALALFFLLPFNK